MLRGAICSVVAFACVIGAAATGGSATPVHLAVGGPLKVAPPKSPKIVSYSAAPILLPNAGGTVTVTATVRAATSCVISGQRRPSGPYIAHRVNCRSGRAKLKFPVLAATSQTQQKIHFRIHALRAGKKAATATASVVEAPAAPPPPPQAPTVSTTDLPEGALNIAYSAQLAVTSGKAPYTWALTSGTMPAGMSLAPSGLLSGTPTVPGDYVVTFQVTDANQLSGQATLVLSIDGPALVLTSPMNSLHSQNWSGYDVNGGPFTYVSGTFNVATMSPVSGTYFAEWVGIDGVTSNTVLQAGISYEFPAGSSPAGPYAWTEVYPAPPIPIPAFAVQAGDQVTVSIGQISAGIWNLRLKNDTTGQQTNVQVNYSSALSSAEWIVEAPADAATNNVLPLGQYSPAVTFTKLLVNGPQSSIDSEQMVQADTPVSTPSPLTANGFTVQYGGNAPGAP
ncbi:MAG TPA: G1 family glutamic endopeptidase [Gaiellaceae bacterium]|nr:G1 family glutamic endopeptidase [Gaiellaceae bacterium]